MSPNLYLRFQGSDEESDSHISLAELGESLQGFDAVFKEFARIIRIPVEPEVQATGHRDGSFVVEIAAWWRSTVDGLPFQAVDDFLTVLRLAKDPLLDEAEQFFNTALGTRKTLNDWVSLHPIDSAILAYLFGKVAKRLMKFAGPCKALLSADVRDLPKRIQLALQKLINKKGFKKALNPITENKVDVIELSDDPGFSDPATAPNTDSGVFLRGQHKSQVNIWCWPVGSGEVWGYRTDPAFDAKVHAAVTPKIKADHPVGEWNTFYIVMKGDRLTVKLNDKLVIDDAQLPRVPRQGPLALQLHADRKDGEWGASLVQFRNIRIKELAGKE